MESLNISETDLKNKIKILSLEIPKTTKKTIEIIRNEISSNEIRDQHYKKPRSTIRLTNEQRNLARDGFKSFFLTMIEYENKFKNASFVLNPEYSIFINSRLALESYTKSMYVCFRCGEIESISNLVKDKGILKHECFDEELGNGDRTSWLYIYATFVRNKSLKEAMTYLDELMEK